MFQIPAKSKITDSIYQRSDHRGTGIPIRIFLKSVTPNMEYLFHAHLRLNFLEIKLTSKAFDTSPNNVSQPT